MQISGANESPPRLPNRRAQIIQRRVIQPANWLIRPIADNSNKSKASCELINQKSCKSERYNEKKQTPVESAGFELSEMSS